MHGSSLILNMYLIILSSSAANDPHVEREKEEVPGLWQETSACRSTDFSKFCLQFLTNYLFNSVLSTSRTIENNFNMHQGFGFNEIILK